MLNCANDRVALRKESVDRNIGMDMEEDKIRVALRKESVDRNIDLTGMRFGRLVSLSARRAWIEMIFDLSEKSNKSGRSPQGERG